MKDYLKKFCLKDRTLCVTGGAGLIGSEVAKALASAGARVIVLDIDERKARAVVREITRSGKKGFYEFFDMTDIEGMEENIRALFARFKKIDGWVNLAYPRTPDWADKVEDLKAGSLRKNVDMHMNSYVWSSRIVALMMRQRKIKGSIVNLGSIYGVQGVDFNVYAGTKMTNPMAYAMIKGGIINGTRYLASYFGKDGIRVNALCPGGIFNHQPPRFVRNYQRKVPLKRMGRPEDIASVVVFLVSDASGYVTGTPLIVDGGWTIV